MQPTTTYEPYRYLENAKEILKNKAIQDGLLYKDAKYVRAAGHYAYTAVLLALNDWIKIQLKKNCQKDKKERED